MKTFVISISLLYFGVHGYLLYSLWNLLPTVVWLRVVAIIVVVLGAVTPMLFFAVGERLPMGLAGAVYKAGTAWMIALLYLVLSFLLMDLVKLGNQFFKYIDREALRSVFYHNGITSLIVLGGVTLLLLLGNVIYHNKERVVVDIKSEKIKRPLKVVGISDLHLGYTIQRKELAKWVEMINSENPDLIVIAGDLIDNQLRPVWEQGMQHELQKLQAPMGVYACTGNHEYISGIKEVTQFYEAAGIELLRDSVAYVGEVAIVGREDYTNKGRKELGELMDEGMENRFTLLLDHQPNNLEAAREHGIDFQLSGHTHKGQVFPGSLLVKRMFELGHGYMQKGDTHYYVSSGLGIWGGKFRIGTRSEYLVLTIDNE